MTQSRRMFLQALGAGAAIVSLPEISSILNLFSLPGGPDEDLKSMLHRLLLGESAGGAFVAHADTRIIEGTPQQLLDTTSGLLNMLDNLGLARTFSNRVRYDNASACGENFQRQEKIWREDHHLNAFTDVKRPQLDTDIAIAVGGKIDHNSNLSYAMGATQYQAGKAVPLVRIDPGVLRATNLLLGRNLSAKELAQGLAVIDKRGIAIDGGQTATRYETPVTTSVYIPRPRLNSGVSGAVGILAAHNKKEPNSVYYTDIYA